MVAREADNELHPDMVLGTYCASLAAGKRVAVLGAATSGLAEQLAAESLRRVHVFDHDAERVARCISATRGSRVQVSFSVLDEDLALSDSVYDLVVIPELEQYDDAVTVLGGAQALLNARGTLVVSVSSGEHATIGYYELYDLLDQCFDTVRMLGQAPFVAYTVADFAAEGEPDVTIDTALMGGSEQPVRFVAVASANRVRVDGYTVIEVPADTGIEWMGGTSAGDNASSAQLADVKAENTALNSELDKLRDRAHRDAQLAQERKSVATSMSARVAELEQEQERTHDDFERRIDELRDEHQEDLDQMLERIAELEAQTVETVPLEEGVLEDEETDHSESDDASFEVEALDELAAASTNIADARTVDGYEFQLEELRRAVAEARSEVIRLRPEGQRAEQLSATLRERDAEIRRHRAALKDAQREANDAASDEAAARDIDTLEQRLRERGQRIADLEAHLRDAQRAGRELVEELNRPTEQPEPPPAVTTTRPDDVGESERVARQPGSDESASEDLELNAHLLTLTQRCSRCEADLQAAEWKITALESELAAHAADSEESPDAQLEQALRAAQEELATLRQSGDS